MPVRYFDSLTLKLALSINLLIILILGVGFFAMSTVHYDRQIEEFEKYADLQNKLIMTA